MSKLEESIKQLMSLWPMNLADQEKLRDYLRSFAEAVREKPMSFEPMICPKCQKVFSTFNFSSHDCYEKPPEPKCEYCGRSDRPISECCLDRRIKKEPKECLCKCTPHCDPCTCGPCEKKSADLPAEVAEKMVEILAKESGIGMNDLESLARLCLNRRGA